MTFPKKHTRSLTVAGHVFLTRISISKSHDQGVFRLNLTVQSASAKGSCLQVTGLTTRDFWLDFDEPQPRPEGAYTVLTPAAIAALIQEGLQQGWDPLESGPPIQLAVSNQNLKQVEPEN
ncbi:MAG TPA: hypothetical protein V6D23_15805 [Candidatus Obscuribacterales bacterium]